MQAFWDLVDDDKAQEEDTRFPGAGRTLGDTPSDRYNRNVGYNYGNVHRGTHYNDDLDTGTLSSYTRGRFTVTHRGKPPTYSQAVQGGHHTNHYGGHYGAYPAWRGHNHHHHNWKWKQQRNAAVEFASKRAKKSNPHYVSQLFSGEHVVV